MWTWPEHSLSLETGERWSWCTPVRKSDGDALRLGRSSTDLSDTRVALENLELTHTPAYTVLRAVIDFEGNQRVTKETEGRPGEM